MIYLSTRHRHHIQRRGGNSLPLLYVYMIAKCIIFDMFHWRRVDLNEVRLYYSRKGNDTSTSTLDSAIHFACTSILRAWRASAYAYAYLCY